MPWGNCEYLMYYHYLHVYSQKSPREGAVVAFSDCESRTTVGRSSVISKALGFSCFFFPDFHFCFSDFHFYFLTFMPWTVSYVAQSIFASEK
jgi:hypothetical protein